MQGHARVVELSRALYAGAPWVRNQQESERGERCLPLPLVGGASFTIKVKSIIIDLDHDQDGDNDNDSHYDHARLGRPGRIR